MGSLYFLHRKRGCRTKCNSPVSLISDIFYLFFLLFSLSRRITAAMESNARYRLASVGAESPVFTAPEISVAPCSDSESPGSFSFCEEGFLSGFSPES